MKTSNRRITGKSNSVSAVFKRLFIVMMTFSVLLAAHIPMAGVYACDDIYFYDDYGYCIDDYGEYWDYEMDGFIDYVSEGIIRRDIFDFEPEVPVLSAGNAFLKTAVHNYGKRHVDTVGIVVYDECGNIVVSEVEDCDRNESTFYIFYDLNEELYTYLTPGEGYSYAFYIDYEGEFYTHELVYFTAQ